MPAPQMRFLSLFVPDVAAAAARYTAIFGVEPQDGPGSAPSPHPFAAGAPVVFELGPVCLALYPSDGRTTHPGDVGIGVEVSDPAATTAAVREQGGQVFFGPRPVSGPGRDMAVFVLPERHFFEVVGSPEGE